MIKQESVQRWQLALAALAAGGWVGCGDGDDGAEGDETGSNEAPHWTYEGEEGPEHWGELGVEYATCASGQQQSPIDIPTTVAAAPLTALEFDYAPGPATILDNGHTVQVGLSEGANVLRIRDQPYDLVQFHFHAHSEHTIGGQYRPLEMHFVHRSASGELAVVGVFLDTGAANGPLAPVFASISSAGAEPEALSGDVDPAQLLPASKDGWTYSGSLTTPPCTEGVKWHVLSSSIPIGATELEAFTARHEVSYRPVMANTSTVTSGD